MNLPYEKLKYPLDRRSISLEAGHILLAYDMIYRLLESGSYNHLETKKRDALFEDAQVNLNQLGMYIKVKIGEDRFEPTIWDHETGV